MIQYSGQLFGEGGAANRTSHDAHQGDADLNRSQKLVRSVGQIQGDLCSLVSLLGLLLESCLAYRDDGNLGHGKETVGQDEHRKNEYLDYDPVHVISYGKRRAITD